MSRLPRPPTSLLGRDEDIAAVLASLDRGARLVTLTGIGGIGKTRLALAVGARLAERGGRVAHCDVVSIHSLPELAVAIADALELEIAGLERGRPLDALTRVMGAAPPTTLVVDNFEHLVGAGADALVACLAAAPGLRLIVTSRVSLSRPDELVVAVQPLRADGIGSAAVGLLAARASGGREAAWLQHPDALCRLAARLDGLPLALELAAARAHLVTPDELVAILDEDVSLALAGQNPRRASRDAAVAWSWDQLDEGQRKALKRLVLLEGSFDFALSVAVSGLPRAQTLTALEALSRYGLLHSEDVGGAVRYRVLETVRDYVLAQIGEAERIEGRDAIASVLVGRVEPHLSSFSRELPSDVAQAIRADRELHLAVLRAGLDSARPATLALALRAATFLVPLFQRTGSGHLAVDWTRAILERPETEAVPLALRLGAAVVVVVAGASGADPAAVDRTVARINAWIEVTPEGQLAAAAIGIVHYYRWEHRTLLTLAEHLLASRAAAKNAELAGYALSAWSTSRRALGVSDGDADDAALAAVLARLDAPSQVTTACLVSLARAHLAMQHGRADALERVEEGLARAAAAGFAWFEALFVLERGRVRHDRGELGLAHADLSQAVARFDARTAVRERQGPPRSGAAGPRARPLRRGARTSRPPPRRSRRPSSAPSIRRSRARSRARRPQPAASDDAPPTPRSGTVRGRRLRGAVAFGRAGVFEGAAEADGPRPRRALVPRPARARPVGRAQRGRRRAGT
ncbi:MAG: hypothetical protein U1F43_20245 [Myxococcota bacterium]